MWRSRWSACIAVAWVAPLVWLAILPFAGPSDGTVVSSPTAVLGDGRWEGSLLVLDTHGGTPLRPGDRILSINGEEITELIVARDAAARAPGDVVRYEVQRPGTGLEVKREVEVPLTRYPLASALGDNPHWVVLALGLLAAGTFLVLRGARGPLALATLAAGAAAVVGLSAHPLGIQAIELTGAGSLWPHVVGELVLGLGLGALIVAAAFFPRPPRLLESDGRRLVLLLAVPYVAYVVWLVAFAGRQPDPARLQAQLNLFLPAGIATVSLVVLALATGWNRARSTADRVALRLLALATLTAAVVVLALDTIPDLLRGSPLVAWEVLAIALVPVVLVCWVAAVLDYRPGEIDAVLRRSLLQFVIAAVVVGVFLAAANAVNLASGTSVSSIVTGGVVALMLLPAALLLRRTTSRLVYGDRAFPYRVVSGLRRLEPTTAPEDAMQEMLALLSRSLRLSYASIEATGSEPADRFVADIGERRGEPTIVVLEVAGTQVGRLEMEVSPLREPFGPRDRRLLEDIGIQVGALVQVLAGNRELQRTRERLVAAREEERRRLRRDLHDGLGPSLATMLMRLEVARDLVERDPGEASLLIGELTDQTEADIAEIRRLVEGLRPPALDQLGLVSALRQRADQHNHAIELGSSSPQWSVVADDLGALPAAVEVAAYRIAVEAVNNAVRHSGGTGCVVTLRSRPDALEIEVRDDGIGLTDDRVGGVGVGSMRDRAEELGGTCTVTTAPGGGTLVTAHLPLANRGRGEDPAS